MSGGRCYKGGSVLSQRQVKRQPGSCTFLKSRHTAILEMRLYRLIGLEIEALEAEYKQTMDNIARYEDILNNYDSMAHVIMDDLDRIKKEYTVKRRTTIENAQGCCI